MLVFCFASIVGDIYYSCNTFASLLWFFVYRQANLCCGLRRNLSPQFIKKNLQFSAEVGLEPGSVDSETNALPMS